MQITQVILLIILIIFVLYSCRLNNMPQNGLKVDICRVWSADAFSPVRKQHLERWWPAASALSARPAAASPSCRSLGPGEHGSVQAVHSPAVQVSATHLCRRIGCRCHIYRHWAPHANPATCCFFRISNAQRWYKFFYSILVSKMMYFSTL